MHNKKQNVIMTVSNDLVADNRVHKIASTLQANSYNVILVGRVLKDSKDLPDLPYSTKRFRLLFNTGALFYAYLNLRIFIYLLFVKADIFTANDLDTLLAVYFAAKIRRKELVYDTHEYFTEVPELAHRNFQKKMWERIEKAIFPKLKHCMTVCKSIADIYSEKYKVNLAVVRNVPFTSANKVQSKTITGVNKPIILYQGAVNLGRGLELMIDAMQHIEFAQLVVIGGGDKLESLKQKVTEMELHNKVFFLGKIHFSELPAYTLQATLGISFEENIGLNYYYALPNKLFDYIQSNVPVLVSDLPEMRRIVTEYNCGEIITERTPEAIANQIANLINSNDLRKKYIANTKIAAKELCWENEKDILLEIYNNCKIKK